VLDWMRAGVRASELSFKEEDFSKRLSRLMMVVANLEWHVLTRQLTGCCAIRRVW
jgi:hypothetical protein